MGDHNALGTVVRLAAAMRRAWGLAHDEDGVVRLSETLTPITDVALPEFWALRGGKLGVARDLDPAVAAQYSCAVLRNPTGSGLLVIVEAIAVDITATSWYAGIRPVGAVDLMAPALQRDSRWYPSNTGAQVGDVSQVALPAVAQAKGSAGFFPWPPYILSPGFELCVFGAVVNTGIDVTFWWRERPAPAELTT